MKCGVAPLIDKMWELIHKAVMAMRSEDQELVYSLDGKKREFSERFENMYNLISQNYMEHPDDPLDRHKIAAIAIVIIVGLQVLSTKNTKAEFVGNYVLATDCALSYMLGELNKKLQENSLNPIQKYYFPEPIACETYYYKIFYRNLYYIDKNAQWSLNPLDIAEKLFLIEYITLKEEKIDINILKEY